MITPSHFWTASGIALVAVSGAFAQDAGTLRGVITDADFGDPLSKVSITVVETGAKVQTNDQGNFSISLPPGRYTVIVAKEGYVRQVKANVVVTGGQLSDLDLKLVAEYEDMDEFIVQEIELGTAEQTLIELKFETPQLLDAVSAEIISRAGASDAAQALLLVPGASVQEGRYAVIRGLPDRYVATLLNGVRLPTSAAERRAVQLDQFPTAILETVQVSKSFTPDQQGDSSGGAINIDLKDIPEETSFQIRGQIGANSQVVGAGSNFLSYQNGNLNYWGNNQGTDIPTSLIGQSWTGYPVGTTTEQSPYLDYKWSASGGGKWEVADGVKVGGFGSFFYESDYSYFDNGISDQWWITPSEGLIPLYGQGAPGLLQFQTNLLDVTEGAKSVQWGTLLAGGIESERHKIGATYLYSRIAVNQATLATNTRGKEYFCGPDFDWTPYGLPYPSLPPYDPNDPSSVANTELLLASPFQRLETLQYTETDTQSVIVNGSHKLGDEDGDFLKIPELDWTLSQSTASYSQPNKTQFASVWLPPSDFIDPSLPGIWIPYQPAENINLGWAQHIWQDIEEKSSQLSLNLKVPFAFDDEREGFIKTGFFGDWVSRTFTQDTFSNRFTPGSPTDYIGGWDDPWSAVFPSENHPIFESTQDVDYNGNQRIIAGYGMAEFPITSELSVIGGVRIESTQLSTQVFGGPDAVWFPPGALVPVDFATNPDAANVNYNVLNYLPAFSVQYEPIERLVFRGSFTQTIARQTFREITPVLQQEFLGGPIFIGNPELEIANLDNYDARIDWTPYDNWLISGSFFYKSLRNTIEYSQFEAPQGFVYTGPVNYPEGHLYGIELEARIDAKAIEESLKGLQVGANLTLIESEVTLPDNEQALFESIGFPLSTRDMTGAPSYLANINVTYDYEDTGTQVGLFYTLTGETLETGAGIDTNNFVPSLYSLAYGTLNLTVQQRIGEYLRLTFQAKNLLNPEIQTAYEGAYVNGSILSTSFTAGIDFSIGLSFQMDF